MINYLAGGDGIVSREGKETYIGTHRAIIGRISEIIDELRSYQQTGTFFNDRPGQVANEIGASSLSMLPLSLLTMKFHPNDATFLPSEHTNLNDIKPVANSGLISVGINATNNTRIGTTSLSNPTHGGTITALLDHLMTSLELHPNDMPRARGEFEGHFEVWMTLQGENDIRLNPKSTDFLREPATNRTELHAPFHEKPAIVAIAYGIAVVVSIGSFLWYPFSIIAGVEIRLLYIAMAYKFFKQTGKGTN